MREQAHFGTIHEIQGSHRPDHEEKYLPECNAVQSGRMYEFLTVNTTMNKINNTGVYLRGFCYHYMFRPLEGLSPRRGERA
jgi:hypothetical protein